MKVKVAQVLTAIFLCGASILQAQQSEPLAQPSNNLGSVEDSMSSDRAQIAVLNNGQIIRGFITKTSQNCSIQTAQGSRIVLQNDQLDFVVDTMVQAYWARISRVKATDLNGQIQLFSWCIEHELLAEAQNQINLLMLTEIKPNRLDYMIRQLQIAHQAVDRKLQPQLIAENTPANSQNPLVPISPIVAPPIAAQQVTGQQTGLGTTDLATVDLATAENGEFSFSPLPKLPGTNLPTAKIAATALPSLNTPNTKLVAPDAQASQLATTLKPLPTPATALAQAAKTKSLIRNQKEWAPPSSFNSTVPPNDPISDPGKIAQVAFEEVVQPRAESNTKSTPKTNSKPNIKSNTKAKRVLPTKQQLDEETKRMPRKAVAMYKRKIEPMLIRGCVATGCHSSSSDTMPLVSLGPSQLIPRLMSQRNMHEILGKTDPTQPLESPLLISAVTPHGGAKKSALKVDTKQFANLANWLIMVSDQPHQTHTLSQEFLVATGMNPTNHPNTPETLTPPTGIEANPLAQAKPNQTLQPAPTIKPFSMLTNEAPDLSALIGGKKKEPAKDKPLEAPANNPLIDDLMDPNVLNDPRYAKLLPGGDGKQDANSDSRNADSKNRSGSETADPFDPDEFNRKFGK